MKRPRLARFQLKDYPAIAAALDAWIQMHGRHGDDGVATAIRVIRDTGTGALFFWMSGPRGNDWAVLPLGYADDPDFLAEFFGRNLVAKRERIARPRMSDCA